MSNRELQNRKLKPHQRRIWTDAFKASLSHVSIEAAERKAWQAVDICERVGAFHESSIHNERTSSDEENSYRDAFTTVTEWMGAIPKNTAFNGQQTDDLWDAFGAFDEGVIDIVELKRRLQSIYSTDGSD